MSKNPQIVKTQVFDDLWVSPYVLGLHNIDTLNNYRIRLLRKVFCLTAQLDPVAVPGALLAEVAAASLTDRCHSLRSLHPPLAALPSLPLSSIHIHFGVELLVSAALLTSGSLSKTSFLTD